MQAVAGEITALPNVASTYTSGRCGSLQERDAAPVLNSDRKMDCECVLRIHRAGCVCFGACRTQEQLAVKNGDVVISGPLTFQPVACLFSLADSHETVAALHTLVPLRQQLMFSVCHGQTGSGCAASALPSLFCQELLVCGMPKGGAS